MTAPSAQYFLVIGNRRLESVAEKLSTEGKQYRQKSLNSGFPNWDSITELMSSPDLAGVVVTFNADAYRVIATSDDPAVERLLAKLGQVPHIALAYETVFSGLTIDGEVPNEVIDDVVRLGRMTRPFRDIAAEEVDRMVAVEIAQSELEAWELGFDAMKFSEVSESERTRANARFNKHGIALTSYKKNVEAAALSVAFIDDIQNHLVFRVYVPAGRLFENESSQLADMFHDWLKSAKGKNVRQSGYKTARGRVIEFFSDGAIADAEWHADVDQFKEFMALVERPVEAESLLESIGVTTSDASDIVSRYGIKLGRLRSDANHERRTRISQIQHEIESELIEQSLGIPFSAIETLVEHLVPGSAPLDGQIHMGAGRSAAPSFTINQQIFGRVEGIVAQSISGDIVQGAYPEQILDLIKAFAGDQSLQLTTALGELADPTAPTGVRANASRRLKTFLLKVGSGVEKAGLTAMQKWIEQQIGL